MKCLMSEVQKRLFAIDQVQGENISYNVPMIFELDRSISKKKLQTALNQMIMNHEILRTSFVILDGEYYQIIAEPWEISIEVKIQNQNIQEMIQSFIRPFDLEKPELFRVQLLEGEYGDFILFDFHHIIFDGGSVKPFFEELSQLYQDKVVERPKIQYRQYTMWKNSLNEQRHEGYWLEKFSSNIPVLDLYTDFVRGQTKSYIGNDVISKISNEQSKVFKQFCRKNKISEYSFFLAAFYILLQRHSRQNELVVGTPTSGRSHPETVDMLGMFVNTLALKIDIENKELVLNFLNRVNKMCLESFSHQDYPFEKLLSNIFFNSDPARNPLFDVMLVLQNNDTTIFTLGDCILTPIYVKNKISKFDLTLSIEDTDTGFEFFWEYSTALFKEFTVQQYSQQYIYILNELITQVERELGKISLGSSEEKIFHKKNQELAQEKQTIIEKFHSIVQTYPEIIAVQFGSEKLTYLELDRRSSIVGEYLQKNGIGKEDIVGLMTDKSTEMVIGIVGILKAGAAYLPLDPTHSKKRIEYMLADSAAKKILVGSLANSDILDKLEFANIFYIEKLKEKDNVQLWNQSTAADLAYIIYTSGTTGTPKGVLIEQRGVVNLAEMQRKLGCYQPGDQVLQYFNYVFDGSISEIFSALLNGCTLKIVSEETRFSPEKLIIEMKNTHCQLVPSFFRVLLDYASRNNKVDDLFAFKRLYLAGETFPSDLAEVIYDLRQDKLEYIFNLYGPTENTVCATAYNLANYTKGQKVPIGEPVTGSKVMILYQEQECGVGLVGEICLAGVGLARGYLNQPQLTDEKFIYKPSILKERIYCTGDLGRWNERGQIDYLGRIDDQIKFRGFRIELGEIENQIRKLTQIKDIVVTVNNDIGSEYLAAYIISNNQIQQNEITEQLSKKLPDYMIPSFYLRVEEFPITSSGKIDRRQLQQLGGLSTIATEEISDIRLTEKQLIIKKIFEETLNIEKINLTDSFFSLGGNSLKAIELANLIEEKFSIKFSIQDVLVLKTIEKIDYRIQQLQEENHNTNELISDMMIFEAEEL